LDGTVAAFDDITLKGAPRSRVVISVKFGALRDPAGGSSGNDGRPRAVWSRKSLLAKVLYDFIVG
jgi:hypothetical protein